ncbi:hypothetical protein JXJ21_21005 [candidate division KSB1 bacterium]|nr:hypothetical protein [candidate division KSB1 bacterium]
MQLRPLKKISILVLLCFHWHQITLCQPQQVPMLPDGWFIQCATSQSLLLTIPDARLLIAPLLFEYDVANPTACLEQVAADLYYGEHPQRLGSTEITDSLRHCVADFEIRRGNSGKFRE